MKKLRKNLDFDLATIRTLCAMVAATFAAASYLHLLVAACG